jgi:hypothetical protein
MLLGPEETPVGVVFFGGRSRSGLSNAPPCEWVGVVVVVGLGCGGVLSVA